MLLVKEAIHQVRTLKSAKYFTGYFPLVRILTKSDFTETIDVHFWSPPPSPPRPPSLPLPAYVLYGCPQRSYRS